MNEPDRGAGLVLKGQPRESGLHTIGVDVEGCDMTTEVGPLVVTSQERSVICALAREVNETSQMGCEPTMSVKDLDTGEVHVDGGS